MEGTTRRQRRIVRRQLRRAVAITSIVALVPIVLVLGTLGAGAATATITSDGPLTAIGISDQLNCSVNHADDTQPEFFGGTACGTFIGVDGTMYFSPAAIPAGQPSTTPFTAVSQTGPTGTGTEGDPFTVVTVVDAGTTGVRLTQTDTYVAGLESYRTDIAVSNSSATPKSVRVYRAGDCFLQNSDSGFGAVDTTTGAVACTTGLEPGSRIEQWFPITPGSSYMEAGFSTVWSTISSLQAFPNTCTCETLLDNGAGLSWDLNVAPSASSTVSSLITFSPLGVAPLSLAKTADAGTVAPGGANGYTITVSNPNTSAVTLDTLTDTLPAGFAYEAGSTTGATTANPTVEGQELTWSEIAVPANGDATLHFGVTAATTPDTYTNQASATAEGFTVAPTGPTAPVTVSGSENPLILSLAPASAENPVGSPHTVTATATRNESPVADLSVSFDVVSGPNVGTAGSAVTGPDGTASFTYTGEVTGTDTIRASALDGETTVSSNDVTKTWTEASGVDLVLTSATQPGSVTVGNNVQTTFSATNTGTTAATGVVVTIGLPPDTTLDDIDPSQGSCDPPVEGAVTCALGTLAAGGGSATIRLLLRAPGTVPEGGTITTSGVASSDQTGPIEPGSDSSATVVDLTPGQASGFVPPGGTLSTGNVATPADNTIISFTLPDSGPGAPMELRAEPDPTLMFCGGQACSGKTAFVLPFTGYEDPTQPPRVRITWDRSVRGRGVFSTIYVQKEENGPIVTVPECRPRRHDDDHHHHGRHWRQKHHRWLVWWFWWLFHRHDHLGPRSGIADPSPCVNARSVDRHGDVTFEILLLSGDPKFGRR
jgi:uncharacterized repeat protein (TIGR01451 family)